MHAGGYKGGWVHLGKFRIGKDNVRHEFNMCGFEGGRSTSCILLCTMTCIAVRVLRGAKEKEVAFTKLADQD